MKKHRQPPGIAPGIYFGLDDQEYHKDTAISRSDVLNLLDSWYDYWISSSLNPDRKRKASTDAMTFGERCHLLLLDERKFFEEYSVTGSGWKAGKKLINRGDFEKIQDSIEEIKRIPDAYAFFQNGMPEVTIVWIDEETGLRMRGRIDYLRTFGGIDYKRARSLQNNQLGWFISDHGYDIQQELYQQGLMQIKGLLQAGKIKAQGEHDPAWVKRFMDDPMNGFRFFFQRSEKPFIFKLKKMEPEILSNARGHISHAKRTYLENIQLHGTGRPPAGNAETEEMSIYHMPRRIIDRGDHTT